MKINCCHELDQTLIQSELYRTSDPYSILSKES